MQLNFRPVIVTISVIIIALIFIGFYTFSEKEDIQSVIAPSQTGEQLQTMAKDPFKHFLSNQQQGEANQPSQAPSNQTIQVGNGSTATTVPVGTDPFKAFLDAQSKAKPEEAAISPFSVSK